MSEYPSIIPLFIDDREERNFRADTKVEEVIRVLLEGDAGHLFLGDSEEPLALDITISEIRSERYTHVHATHCLKIDVTVEYAGRSRAHSFPPTAKVKAVRDWAVTQFAISPEERPKFGIFLPDETEPLSETRRIGTLIQKGTCHTVFELALRERWQG